MFDLQQKLKIFGEKIIVEISTSKNIKKYQNTKISKNIKKYVGNIRPAQYSGRNFWWQQKWYFSKDIRLIDISHGYLVNRSGGTKFLVPAIFGRKNGVFCLAKIIVHTFGKNSYRPYSKKLRFDRHLSIRVGFA